MFCRDNAHCSLIVRAPTPWQPRQPQATRGSVPPTPHHFSALLKAAVPRPRHRPGMLGSREAAGLSRGGMPELAGAGCVSLD